MDCGGENEVALSSSSANIRTASDPTEARSVISSTLSSLTRWYSSISASADRSAVVSGMGPVIRVSPRDPATTSRLSAVRRSLVDR